MSEAASEAAEPVSLVALFAPPGQRAEAAPAVGGAAGTDGVDGAGEALAEAWRQGHATATAELTPTIEMLRVSLAESERRRAAATDTARETAAGLATAIEACFARELATLALAATAAILKAPIGGTTAGPAASTIESLIGEAVSGLGGGTLFVAAATAEHARPLAPPGWTVVARDGLAPGMVEAESGPALQRASLAGRLEQLLEGRP